MPNIISSCIQKYKIKFKCYILHIHGYYYLSKSNRKHEKIKAVIDNKKNVHFGQKGFSDFTLRKNEDRNEKYIQRHKKKKMERL